MHYGSAADNVRADKMVRLLSGKISLIDRHFPAWQRPFARALFQAWPLSRMIATRALGTVTGRAGFRASAASWSEIWARRAEWRTGWRTG